MKQLTVGIFVAITTIACKHSTIPAEKMVNYLRQQHVNVDYPADTTVDAFRLSEPDYQKYVYPIAHNNSPEYVMFTAHEGKTCRVLLYPRKY